MARPRLTKEAIAFIIECRESPSEIYTWDDIAKLVAEKFDIHVSFQAIAKNYEKHKDNVEIQSLKPAQINNSNRNKTTTVTDNGDGKSNPVSDLTTLIIQKNLTTKENQRKEFVETSEEDFINFLKGE